jgi:hypothetical protein
MAHARTRPREAVSALSEWAEFYGFHRIPGWLRNEQADAVAQRWARRIVVLSLFIGLVGIAFYLRTPQQPVEIPSSSRETPNPTPTSEPGRSSPVYGALQPWQSAILINALAGMKEELHSKIMIARPHISEPQQFSRMFEAAGMRAGLAPVVIEQNPTGIDQTGVMVAVPDISAPSSTARKIRDIIKQLGFEGGFVPLLASPESSQAKESGDFAIFIGPSPL